MGNTQQAQGESDAETKAITLQPSPIYGGPGYRKPGGLYFVRHGEAEHNPSIKKAKSSHPNGKGLLTKSGAMLDPTLTPKGEEQARSLRQWCKLQGISFDTLVTTPLSRALKTANIALQPFVTGKCIVTPDCTDTSHSSHTKLGNAQKGYCIVDMISANPFLTLNENEDK